MHQSTDFSGESILSSSLHKTVFSFWSRRWSNFQESVNDSGVSFKNVMHQAHPSVWLCSPFPNIFRNFQEGAQIICFKLVAELNLMHSKVWEPLPGVYTKDFQIPLLKSSHNDNTETLPNQSEKFKEKHFSQLIIIF